MPEHTKDGTTDAQEYVNSLDREIRPGDVAYDKNSGSWLYVLTVEADTVREYDNRTANRNLLTYAGNQLTACTLEDRVVGAVHLNKNTTKSAGSGSKYDFPVGRLTRFVPEKTDDGIRRVQDTLRDEVLTDLLVESMSDGGGLHGVDGTLIQVIRDAYGSDVARKVESVARSIHNAQDDADDDTDGN